MNKIILKYLKILITQTILLLVLVSCGINTNPDDISLKTQNSLSVIIISSDISLGLNQIKFALLNLEGNPILNEENKLKVFISPLDSPQLKKSISIEWEPWPISGGVYSTNIDFNIPSDANVTIKIFNLLGEEVTTLINSPMDAGYHHLNWDASFISSGIYFIQMSSNNFSQTEKVILLK